MNTPSLALCAVAALAASALPASAQEVTARVISSTPVTQTVAVPRHVCTNQPVVVGQPNTGTGAVVGAVAGGLIGSTLGGGAGRALATAAGVVGGAMAGNSVEAQAYPGTVQQIPSCQTQTFQENRVVGYNVVYEFNGQQQAAFMQQDPGPTVQLQLSPVGAANPGAALPVGGSPVMAGVDAAPPLGTPYAGSVYPATGYPAAVYPAAVYPAPVYAAPVVYARPYLPPVITMGFGWRPYHHRHWR